VSASLAIARAAEGLGDRAGAYEALATGWATLSDLLGKESANKTFMPLLEAQRDRWGAEAFAGVKSQHDEARRRTLSE
jgi:hypothetical protein